MRVERADDLPSLANGRSVEKSSGDYTFDGLAIPFRKRNGAIRWLVENDAGIVHIMSGRQIGIEGDEVLAADKQSAVSLSESTTDRTNLINNLGPKNSAESTASTSGPDLRAAAQNAVDAWIAHEYGSDGLPDAMEDLRTVLAFHPSTGEADHGE